MRYKAEHNELGGNWSYLIDQKDFNGLTVHCGYNHEQKKVYYKVYLKGQQENHQFTNCSYDDFINQNGEFERIKLNIIAGFDEEIFETLKSKIEKNQSNIVGHTPAKEDTIYSNKVVQTVSTTDSFRPNPSKDWTKTGDHLQKFNFATIRNARLKHVPLYIKVITFPLVGFLVLFSLKLLYSSILILSSIGILKSFILLIICYFIIMGIADRWTKIANRNKPENLLVNGLELAVALHSIVGDRITVITQDEGSLKEIYKKLPNATEITKEHLFNGENYRIGYCEVLYSSLLSKKIITTQRSCFAIETNNKLKKETCSNSLIQNWFEENLDIDLRQYLNTRGFTMTVIDNHIILLFNGLFYKTIYVYEVYLLLIAAFECKPSIQKGKS